MHQLPAALAPLADYSQFILYKKIPSSHTEGKLDKIPLSPHNTEAFPRDQNWQTDPCQWSSAAQACAVATAMGEPYGVGFLLTDIDPFWFLDIDNCYINGAWSPESTSMVNALGGCAVEVSQSGKGLHLFGTGAVPPHRCKNKDYNCEFYHTGRFIALTGLNTVGHAALDCSAALPALVSTYFAPRTGGVLDEWTVEPVEHYTSTETDEELIARALDSGGVKDLFGRGVTFRDLWEGNEAKLIEQWPEEGDRARGVDESSTDMALAQHLAFWTGGNCERMYELMYKSNLVREKWARDDYLKLTIRNSCAMQETFYSVREPVATIEGACKLRGSSPEQIAYAEGVRAQILLTATPEEVEALKSESSAKLWLDAKELSAPEMVQQLTPISQAGDVYQAVVTQLEGERYLTAALQEGYFKGCAYVTSEKGVFTPSGEVLSQDVFNSVYSGGYDFEMGLKKKDTAKPWDALLNSALLRWPRVHKTCFKPLEVTGVIVRRGDKLLVNSYKEIPVPSVEGDVSRFKTHLRKLLPDERDRTILLSYMAACVQHKGHKFQWSPFVQGVEGNGKSFLSYCIINALGEDHTHMPLPHELGEKYNGWAFNKLFIAVEDVYVTQNKQFVMEIVKPMITNARWSKRAMQKDQEMQEMCSNWMLNSNHQDGYRKTGNDRRVAPFFTAQQHIDDLERDGMAGNYCRDLYRWAEKGGYAAITHYLQHYDIPVEYNPAVQVGGEANVAPITTSTLAAIEAGRGTVEQEILECIDQGAVGFRGGWISSIALDKLLAELRKDVAIPRNKRRALLQSLGYDHHPMLVEGKASRRMDIDDGGRPKLYVKKHRDISSEMSPTAATTVYQKAQEGTDCAINDLRIGAVVPIHSPA